MQMAVFRNRLTV